jgi:hypothetical protein
VADRGDLEPRYRYAERLAICLEAGVPRERAEAIAEREVELFHESTRLPLHPDMPSGIPRESAARSGRRQGDHHADLPNQLARHRHHPRRLPG